MSNFKGPNARPGMTVAQAMQLDPSGMTYTFVEKNGTPTHIASGVLVRSLAAYPWPVTPCFIAPSLVAALKRNDLGVEIPHAMTLTDEALEVPGTVCEWGHEHVIADGAHRLWRRWKRGDRSFPAYVVPETVWRQFVITDIPGSGAFWDRFNRTAQVRTPEIEALSKRLRGE